jgi:ankyrin repeat protein
MMHQQQQSIRLKELNRQLLQAASLGQVDGIGSLLESRAEVNATDPTGITPLMLAAHGGHKPAVEVLIAHGANLDAQNKIGYSALVFAANGSHSDVYNTLINAKAKLIEETQSSPMEDDIKFETRSSGNSMKHQFVEAATASHKRNRIR